MITQQKGRAAEEKALKYLLDKGLKFVMSNYTCRLGEVDLIMRDKDYLVFVEVRARKNISFGGGMASITHAKRQKIIKTTAHYVMKNKLQDKVALRFDVISIDGASGAIIWVKDAFGTDY